MWRAEGGHMEFFQQFGFFAEFDYTLHLQIFFMQLYWLLIFFIAIMVGDVDTLMQIVYDERHILPRHAHTLAGRATLYIIRRYVASRYSNYRILRDVSMHFRHSLYDIWLLLPELRRDVDVVRKEFGHMHPIA